MVKMVFPSTGHRVNLRHHHHQLRELILEHTSTPRKRKPLKIFYFLSFTTQMLQTKTRGQVPTCQRGAGLVQDMLVSYRSLFPVAHSSNSGANKCWLSSQVKHISAQDRLRLATPNVTVPQRCTYCNVTYWAYRMRSLILYTKYNLLPNICGEMREREKKSMVQENINKQIHSFFHSSALMFDLLRVRRWVALYSPGYSNLPFCVSYIIHDRVCTYHTPHLQ
jgi:hypothetical protein